MSIPLAKCIPNRILRYGDAKKVLNRRATAKIRNPIVCLDLIFLTLMLSMEIKMRSIPKFKADNTSLIFQRTLSIVSSL
jgi:hypothetical protein